MTNVTLRETALYGGLALQAGAVVLFAGAKLVGTETWLSGAVTGAFAIVTVATVLGLAPTGGKHV